MRSPFYCLVAVVTASTFREENGPEVVGEGRPFELSDEDFVSLLDELDTNQDGKLSVPEFEAKLASDFKAEYNLDAIPEAVGSLVEEMDMNEDNEVNKEELSHLLNGMEAALEKSGLVSDHEDAREAEPAERDTDEEMAALLEQVDTDKDGNLSIEEVMTRMKADFKEEYKLDHVPASVTSLIQEGDVNKNGFIDRAEIPGIRAELEVALEKEGLLEQEQEQKKETAAQKGKADAKLEAETAEFAELMEHVDTDGDGKLSVEEVLERMKADFKEEYGLDAVPASVVSVVETGDVDKSGFIEQSEVTGVRANMEIALAQEGLIETTVAAENMAEVEEEKEVEEEDGDGRLADLDSRYKTMLDKVDTDNDGKASVAEVQVRMGKDFEEEYGLTKIPEAVLSLLEEGDADKSGFIEMGEIDSIAEKLEPVLEELDALLEEEGRAEIDAEAPEAVDFSDDDFKLFLEGTDADKDGHLSLAELTAAMEEDFDTEYDEPVPENVRLAVAESDANGDGEVDKGELAQLLVALDSKVEDKDSSEVE